MSHFTERTGWCVRLSGVRYRVKRPLSWEIGAKGSGLWLTVPEGFVFDVSIPRLLWWAFDPNDARYRKAGALHDYALSLGWNRVPAAAAFSESLRAHGLGRLHRLAMVLAVIVWKWR